jgi:hypothetical protein
MYECCLEIYVCSTLVPCRAVLLQLLSVGCQTFRNLTLSVDECLTMSTDRQIDRQTDRRGDS